MPLQRGGDKALKKRMRGERFRIELGVKLHRHKPRMIGEFHNLDQLAIGTRSGQQHSRFFKLRAVLRVELVAMPMTFGDLLTATTL